MEHAFDERPQCKNGSAAGLAFRLVAVLARLWFASGLGWRIDAHALMLFALCLGGRTAIFLVAGNREFLLGVSWQAKGYGD